MSAPLAILVNESEGGAPADYQTFLRSKLALAPLRGLALQAHTPNPLLKGHQQAAAQWALNAGSGLVAASFGLGKTRIQCEIAGVIVKQTQAQFLVVCPLGVKHQFAEKDGPALGQKWQYVRTDAEVKAADTPFLITNFERIREGNINPALHDIAGVSIDEGQALRDLGSDTYNVFAKVFENIRFRYVNSATPAPNNYIELLNYAEFLGVMDRGQALTRWFKRDSSKAGNLTLHPHHEEKFGNNILDTTRLIW